MLLLFSSNVLYLQRCPHLTHCVGYGKFIIMQRLVCINTRHRTHIEKNKTNKKQKNKTKQNKNKTKNKQTKKKTPIKNLKTLASHCVDSPSQYAVLCQTISSSCCVCVRLKTSPVFSLSCKVKKSNDS